MMTEQERAERGWPSVARVAFAQGPFSAHACQPGRWWLSAKGVVRCIDCGAVWVSRAVEGEGPGCIGEMGE